jgi:hypothetical protein
VCHALPKNDSYLHLTEDWEPCPITVAMEVVTLCASDIVDASKRSMFKYVQLNVRGLQALLNLESIDESALLRKLMMY